MARNRIKKKTRAPYAKTKGLTIFRQKLFGRKRFNPKSVFLDLNDNGEYSEKKAVAEYLSSPSNPYHKFVFGKPFAKTFSDIYTEPVSGINDDIQRNLDWVSLSLCRYSKEISSFVEKADVFQHFFLQGSYEQANIILESITDRFGLSLWALEKRFLLEEYGSGLEANKAILGEIVGDETNSGMLQLIAEYMSLRCEIKLSTDNYKRRLDRLLEEDDDAVFPVVSYIRYRLEPLNFNFLSITPFVTFFESGLPVIDRYISFITILQSCLVEGNEYLDIAANTISKIEGKIVDPRIDAMVQFFSPPKSEDWTKLDTDFLKILDAYTDGRYEISATESKKLLVEHPDLYELYYIYIRSTDFLGKTFSQVFPNESIAASILKHTNVIIKGAPDWLESATAILKISTSLWRDPLAYSLYNFFVNEARPLPEKQFEKLSLLNTLPINPRFAAIFEDVDKANNYFKQRYENEDSSTLSLMKMLTATPYTGEKIIFPPSIPETRKQVYTGTLYEYWGQYNNAISILKPLLISNDEDKVSDSFHTRKRITKRLFNCYLETYELAECTNMVVQSFMRNELSTKWLPLILLIKAIDESPPEKVIKSITYPLLYSIVHTKARTIYVAYDNFLGTLGVVKPTQLFDIATQFPENEFHEFLFRVCVPDVLACSYHFTGTKEIESERIRICQYLSEKIPKKAKIYSDEISAITSRSLIREGMRHIDVSKIYVDEDGIRSSGRRISEESFNRYRELASMRNIEDLKLLSSDKNIFIYTISEDGELVKKETLVDKLVQNLTKSRNIHSSLFKLFRELFMDLRDRFISSGEYGLDGYLSVRIRHGVLQNQIRSPFEALHLISEMDTTTGEYLSNHYWDIRLKDISEEDRLLIQKLLANLSREVDLIAQRLNKEMIQVKTEKKNDSGLFDYVFDDSLLLELFEYQFVDIIDFDQFLDNVFRVLWSRTKENLQQIQTYISNDLNDTIYQIISTLDSDIRDKVVPHKIPELMQNIARCQTDIQNVLESVAQWFTVSESSLLPQISINDLVNICVVSINNIYPHKKVCPECRHSGDIIIDGSFFTPFFDILRTLMDNVIVHAGLTPKEMGIEIETSVSGDFLLMKIKNNLSDDNQHIDLVPRLSDIHQSLKEEDITSIISKEGNSGLMKVRKIMAIDLKSKNSVPEFSYDESGKFVVTIEMELQGLGRGNSDY